jgi:hypothetical protein
MDNFPTDINTILKSLNKRIIYENKIVSFINERFGLNSVIIGDNCRKELNINNIWVHLMLKQESNTNMSRNYYDEMFMDYINNSGSELCSYKTPSLIL